MKLAGQIVLFRFSQADLDEGKLPSEYDDWLICMISSQIRRRAPDSISLLRQLVPVNATRTARRS